MWIAVIFLYFIILVQYCWWFIVIKVFFCKKKTVKMLHTYIVMEYLIPEDVKARACLTIKLTFCLFKNWIFINSLSIMSNNSQNRDDLANVTQNGRNNKENFKDQITQRTKIQ